MNHDHLTSTDDDVCAVCDEIICADCGRILDYIDNTYRHRDGSTCFLHQTT